MKRQSLAKLKKIISRFNKARVLVVGDLMLDEFVWGKVDRISPEAPVPVVWTQDENSEPGGAGNVAANITALGGKVELVGVIGDDEKGRSLKSKLENRGIDTSGIISDESRLTASKTRVIANKQQVLRIDNENMAPFNKRIASKIKASVKERISGIDILIVEDYGKGVITSDLLKYIIPLAKREKKIIAVDPKENHFMFYKGVNVITPNHKEAAFATGINITSDKDLHKSGDILLKKLKCDTVLITRGEEGMSIFKKGKKPVHIPTLAQEVFDVSGAGDTVIGVFSLSLASGATSVQAAHIANCAAGIVVGKMGIKVIAQKELIKKITGEIRG